MIFAHTLETTAAAEQVWELWTDVAGWPRWDTALCAARLDGPFVYQAQGRLQATGSPESRFTVVELEPGRSYTIAVPLLLAELRVRRALTPMPAGTRYTHEVSFAGSLEGLFGLLLGRRFRAMLPEVMERLRQLVEQPREAPAAATPVDVASTP
ncbi:MAG: hypothetical protein OHK0015_40260 [Chloroflexi bacterium OHK40]